MSSPESPQEVPAAAGAQDSSDPHVGENVCPDCAGTGRVDGARCATCGGDGTRSEVVADA
ncbi:MAG: hypothetical protein WD794_12435 [Mycobacteriales bacterium]